MILAFNGFALNAVRQDDPIRDDLSAIDKAAQRAATLTRQLLAFSRKQILQPEALYLSRAVTQMEKMLRRVIDEAHAALRVDVKSGPYVLLAINDTGCVITQPSGCAPRTGTGWPGKREELGTRSHRIRDASRLDQDRGHVAVRGPCPPGPADSLPVTGTSDGRTRVSIPVRRTG